MVGGEEKRSELKRRKKGKKAKTRKAEAFLDDVANDGSDLCA